MDEQKTHAIEGTGLGLSIVQQFLDLMGGTVSVSSEYGKGTIFHIEIPQAVADPSPIGEATLKKAERTERTDSQSALAVQSLRILAVDDTPMNLKVVQKLLRDTAAAVDTAARGREALQKTLETRYDVILMDHQMPEMDGVECLSRIRSQKNGMCHDSKIICLTANAGPDIKKLCQETGFDGFLSKPIQGKTLEDEIMCLVSNEES